MISAVLRVLKEAAISVCGLLLGVLVVLLVRDPFSYNFVPKILQTWTHGQRMDLYLPDQKGGLLSAGSYSVYRFSFGSDQDFTGRLIIRDDNGKDTDSQSYVTGSRQNGIMAFTFRPVDSGNPGGGNFIGKENSGAYLGSMVGFAKGDSETECVLMRFIAVVADDRRQDFQTLAMSGLSSYIPWSPPDPAMQVKYSCPPNKP